MVIILDPKRDHLYYALGSCTTSDSTPITHAIQDHNYENWQFHQEYEQDLTFYTNGTDFIKIEEHELDKKYPHTCHKCGNQLKWLELINANKDKDRKHLEKLWKSKIIEFYCCNCYKKE